ncbi:Oxysterol binding protein [Tritrichomonas foetus]|uniref:Oxysterol binding protein n=1 Tax=Tritrichomonas foetus TaxID=1144522 RepID=A0A1J4K1W0_9EUKA|nr:Oxysterol binding protein [Tritrichomonas foetus]|eukprot:OHT03724.1 Oxysterol binding protein [Tritrichomonas foetus]
MALCRRSEAPQQNDHVGSLEGRKYYNSSYANVTRQELNPADTDYARERDKAINHNSKEGVKPMSKEEQDFERQLNWKLIKKFTMAIFSMDVTRFSFPVGYSEPRTFIERAADLFSFLSTTFMEKAVAEPDNSKRLAMITVGVIAPFHLYLQAKKPWNPVIGETYIGKWSNGIMMFGEQTSHHPPVSNIQLTTPDNSWKVDAQFNFEIDQGIFQIDILQKGNTKLTLADGTVYEWEFPTICVTGLLKGDRIVKVQGPLEIRDVTNNLTAHIKINPKQNKKIKELKHPRVTTIYGGVCKGKYDEKKKFLSVVTGDYADKVYIDGELEWNISRDLTHRPLEILDDNELLPSDCRFRIDRTKLINGNMDEADKAKQLVEELQRHDSKVRASGEKHQKKENHKQEKERKKREKEAKIQHEMKNLDVEVPAQ